MRVVKDRLGNTRCAGYKREAFEVCDACNKGFVRGKPCPKCGGYGEVPKQSAIV